MSKVLNIHDFLIENSVEDLQKEVIISSRLKDYPFTISAVTSEQMENYRKQAGANKVNRKGSVDIDMQKLQRLLILNHTIEPNFKDAEAIKKAEVVTPDQYMAKVLLAGESQNLVNAITELSGLQEDMEELIEEAKNS